MLIFVLGLVLKDSLRTCFQSLSLSWSLRVRSLSLSLGGPVQEVLVFVVVLVGQVLVLVLVLGGQVIVLVLVLGGQVLVNIPAFNVHLGPRTRPICPYGCVSVRMYCLYLCVCLTPCNLILLTFTAVFTRFSNVLSLSTSIANSFRKSSCI